MFTPRSPHPSTAPSRVFASALAVALARLFIVVGLTAAALSAAAAPADDCPPDLTATLIRQFGYADDTPHLDACKRMPGDRQRAIVALSFLGAPMSDDPNESDMGDYDLDLAVVDVDTAQVHQRLKRSAVYVSDALRLSSIEIDTAPYVLAPGQRAFGVRAHFSGSSRINPFGHTVLSLYRPDARGLRVVLDDLTVARSNGEWDGNCAGEFSSLKRVLILGTTSNHGSADLIVRSTTGGEVQTLVPGRNGQADDCDVQPRPARTTQTVLRFDGKRYDTRALGSD